jgi:acylphosphatase
MAPRSAHVTISGRVQGVGYRAWTAERAAARGLSGWVRNRRDGGVEAVFCGDPREVDAMIADCAEGPRLASVRSVDVRDSDTAETGPFRVLPTI